MDSINFCDKYSRNLFFPFANNNTPLFYNQGQDKYKYTKYKYIYLYLLEYTCTYTCTWLEILVLESVYVIRVYILINLKLLSNCQTRIRPYNKEYPIIVILSQKQNNFARLSEKYSEKGTLLFCYENILELPYENVLSVGTTTSGVWKRSSTSILIQVQV